MEKQGGELGWRVATGRVRTWNLSTPASEAFIFSVCGGGLTHLSTPRKNIPSKKGSSLGPNS